MKKTCAGIIILFCLGSDAAGQTPQTLEKIVVKAAAGGASVSRETPLTEQISGQQIAAYGLATPVELCDAAAGLDRRSRAAYAIQSDLSLRGSTYEQVAVLVDGANVSDPQTGHHSLNLGLTSFDVDALQVSRSPAASGFGKNALAGAVNFIVRPPLENRTVVRGLYGAHALSGQGFSFSRTQAGGGMRLSFERSAAKAARPDTDFSQQAGTWVYLHQSPQLLLHGLVGFQKKDFGADSFYSNLFPREEEHTQTVFSKAGWELRLEPGTFTQQLFLRQHRDKFILNRHQPTSVNYHTTYVSGLNSEYKMTLPRGQFKMGLELGSDQINSTNLGRHTRLSQAETAGIQLALWPRLTCAAALRLDYYQQWSWQESYTATCTYALVPERLNWYSSYSRSLRIPSFTELYYADAANKGNPDLQLERADTLTSGIEHRFQRAAWGIEGFLRQGRQLIDWTRPEATVPWQATNLGSVNFSGGMVYAKLSLAKSPRAVALTDGTISYTYTHADRTASGFLSKYALDIAQHQLIGALGVSALGIAAHGQASFVQRAYGETYCLVNLTLTKSFSLRGLQVEPFVKIDNLGNTKYSEVGGVLQPGRWLSAGLRLEW